MAGGENDVDMAGKLLGAVQCDDEFEFQLSTFKLYDHRQVKLSFTRLLWASLQLNGNITLPKLILAGEKLAQRLAQCTINTTLSFPPPLTCNFLI